MIVRGGGLVSLDRTELVPLQKRCFLQSRSLPVRASRTQTGLPAAPDTA